MMKNVLIGLGAAALLTAIIIVPRHLKEAGPQSKYTPRDVIQSSADGMSEYLASIRGDVNTGIVDPVVYRKVQEQARMASAKRGALGLKFDLMGPNNIGGRTRAILVDNENSDRIYAAGVSGGMFISTNGGQTWTTSFQKMESMLITSICQTTDGAIFIGTAASFENSGDKAGTPGGPGVGIFKSTDRGQTWRLLPTATYDPGDPVLNTWQWVNELKAHPSKSNFLAAATARGVRVSKDGGATWINNFMCIPNSDLPLPKNTHSIEFSKDGDVLYVGNADGTFYYGNPSGAVCNFVQATEDDGFTNGSSRLKLSASRLSNKKVWAARIINSGGSVFRDILESVDGGKTWKMMNPPLPHTDPNFVLCGDNGQCWYNLSFAVAPDNDDKMFLGGVQFWRYDGNWTQAAVGGGGGNSQNEFMMHVDHHTIAFDPKNPDIIYYGNDGGVWKSLDGGYTYFDINRGYATTQFYGMDIANYDLVVGGTQDNGVIVLTPFRPGNPDFGYTVTNENVINGDGFDCAISKIVDLKYTSAQNTNFGRGNIAAPRGGGACGTYCNQGRFYTHLRLWESPNDPYSKDYLTFNNDTIEQNFDIGTAVRRTFDGAIVKTQPAGEVILESIRVGTFRSMFKYVGKGVLEGDGTGTFDEKTLSFSVNFNEAPALNERVNVYYAMRYKAGSIIYLSSQTGQIRVEHVLQASMSPGDELRVKDPVNSIVTASINVNAAGNNSPGLIFSRHAINTAKELEWLHLPLGGVTEHEFSPDGRFLFYDNGSLRRLDSTHNIYTQDDIDDILAGGAGSTLLNPAGEITGIAFHPEDPNTVVVTVGSYGVTNHVYIIENALTSAPTSRAIQGNLPEFPVYDAAFVGKGTKGIILATDMGVWSTSDYSATAVEWTSENSTFGNYAVFDIDIQHLDHNEAQNSGYMYLATHGRGIWKSTDLVNVEYKPTELKLPDNWVGNLKIYPNPVRHNLNMSFDLNTEERIEIQVFDINGNLVKHMPVTGVSKGFNQIQLSVSDLRNGTYFINLVAGNERKVNKMIVMH
jgi:WD40 repeat protein